MVYGQYVHMFNVILNKQARKLVSFRIKHILVVKSKQSKNKNSLCPIKSIKPVISIPTISKRLHYDTSFHYLFILSLSLLYSFFFFFFFFFFVFVDAHLMTTLMDDCENTPMQYAEIF